MSTRGWARSRDRRGAAAVEFAFVAPVIFTFLFASIEFSRATMLRDTANNAAYEGARQAIVPGATANDAEQAVANVLSALRVRGATVTVNPATISSNTIDVTVDVHIPLSRNSLVASRLFAGKDMVGTCTLRREEVLSRLPQ